MADPKILILGAAYGLLPALRLVAAGFRVTVVCRPAEQEAMLARGARVEFLRRDGQPGRTLHATAMAGLPDRGHLGVAGPEIDPRGFDLVFLAMSEPQYAAAEIADLLSRIAAADLPIVSLMNALPPPFLRRLGTADVDRLAPAYAAWDSWQVIPAKRMTAASPDAQAVRRDPAHPEILSVTLASNFKVAPFAEAADQAVLEEVVRAIAACRPDGAPLPARILAHEALHVPLAKWPMLITGNARCLDAEGRLRSIGEAVHDDLARSRDIYSAVCRVVFALGAGEKDLVPFEAYAQAARALSLPSSFGRAIAGGALRVERIDRMVQLAASDRRIPIPGLDEIVVLVDRRLNA